MKFGYLKDTGVPEELNRQTDLVQTAGVDRILTDVAGTPKATRPKLRELREQAAGGDTIFVANLTCLGRNLKDLLEQLEFYGSRSVRIVSLEEQVDTASEAGKLLPGILRSLLRFDRKMTAFWNPRTD